MAKSSKQKKLLARKHAKPNPFGWPNWKKSEYIRCPTCNMQGERFRDGTEWFACSCTKKNRE